MQKLWKWIIVLLLSGIALLFIVLPLLGTGLTWISGKYDNKERMSTSRSQFEYKLEDGNWSRKYKVNVREKGGITSLAFDSQNSFTDDRQRTVFYITNTGNIGTYEIFTLWNKQTVEEGIVDGIVKTTTGWEFNVTPTTNELRGYEARIVEKNEFGY